MKILKTILSWIYGAVIYVRHRLYDWGVLKSHTFDIPVVCIGNITVGGTGKTPMAEMLISSLSNNYNIALLSRGYGRRTKGYREVTIDDSYLDVGDEPLQIKLKFSGTLVVVAEDRVKAIRRIREEHPEVNLIIMDDGLQHRSVRAKVNVIVMDATRPIENDHLMPRGRLRDLKSRLTTGHFFMVSKCPEAMTPLDRRLWHNKLRTIAYQKVYFSRMEPLPIVPLFEMPNRETVDYASQAILVAGVGNPKSFVSAAEMRFTVVDKYIVDDHHRYNIDDMNALMALHKRHHRAIILMTEKDAVKLRRSTNLPESLRRAMYYQPVEMSFIEGPDQDFIGKLIDEIEHGDHSQEITKNKEE
ncbi:MAG: tetraacyldisaccharide 4'-kinase [Alistipes sp.]|nr:tetraacyldisaccharide 4'-kinase [Alistipes sp.]